MSHSLVEGEQRCEIRCSRAQLETDGQSPRQQEVASESRGPYEELARKQHGKKGGTERTGRQNLVDHLSSPDSGHNVWNTHDASHVTCFIMKWFCRKNVCLQLIFMLFSSY